MTDFADAIAANRDAIVHASMPQLRTLLPVLKQAESETARGLSRFLREHPGEQRYTLHVHRQMLLQLREAIATIDHKLEGGLATDLVREGTTTGHTAFDKLNRMVEAGSLQFEGSIRTLRVDVAASMTNARNYRLSQFPASARRYAGEVGMDLRNRFMLSVVRGETVDQLASRLMKSSGLIKVWRAAGFNQMAEGAVGQVFGGYRYAAERLARTELADHYNAVQARAIRDADRADPGYLMLWDSAHDKRACDWCKGLDGASVLPGQSFPGGASHPPLHPFCRCAVVPWRSEWGGSRAWYPLLREHELN